MAPNERASRYAESAQLGRSTAEQRRCRSEINEAMWSIYVHTMFRNGVRGSVVDPSLGRPRGDAGADCDAASTDRGLEPMRLDEAISRVAKGGDDDHDRARQKIALEKLVNARLHETKRLAALHCDSDTAASLCSEIHGLAETLGCRLPDAARSDHGLLPPRDEMRLMLNALHMESPKDGCRVINSTCVACRNAKDLNTTVTGTATVRRRPSELARIVDPRAWGRCHHSFQEIYRCMDDHPDYSRNPSNDATPLGVPWVGPFFERVQAGPVVFDNVLDVTRFEAGPDHVYLEYQLRSSLRTFYPLITRNGGLEIDEGFTRVTRIDDEWSKLEFQKKVRFSDLTPGSSDEFDYGELLNYWAPAALTLWVEEGTEVGPCCAA